jgi:xanthine/uracil permease
MSSPAIGLRTRPLTYAGLFVVTLSTLAYEIVLTRIFSVTMWYHFAFVAISVALFGTTAGALIVHLRPDRFTEDKVKRQMAKYSLAYAVSISVAFACQLALPFRIEANAGAMASVVLTCVLISVPFVCAGVVVCLALTKFGDKVNRLYAADLIGAGLGCLGLVIAFNYFDGPSLVILVAAVAALGGMLLAIDASSRGWQVLGALVTIGLLLGAFGNRELHERNKPAVKILYTKDERDHTHLADRWNAFSRLTVDGNPETPQFPFGNGLSTEMPDDTTVEQLNIVIDSTAGTVMTRYNGDPDQTVFL